MHKPSQRAAIVVASALGALVLALPGRSSADPYWYGNYGWGAADPYGEGIEHEQEEIDQGRAAQQHHWHQLQHEQREMDQALREGDWDQYRHEQEEAEQAADALQRDQAQIEHEQRELRQQQRAFRHHRYDWDED
jgi:hypothetical protein